MTLHLICKNENIKVSKGGRVDCIEEGRCPKCQDAYCFNIACFNKKETEVTK